MVFVVSVFSWMLRKTGYRGIALWPFVFLAEKADVTNKMLVNHEKIHHRQQVEMLVLFFYVWYLIEYISGRFRGLKHDAAYRSICFEKEAFENESNLNYLEKRPFWAVFRKKTP